jgi:hypothetical protein
VEFSRCSLADSLELAILRPNGLASLNLIFTSLSDATVLKVCSISSSLVQHVQNLVLRGGLRFTTELSSSLNDRSTRYSLLVTRYSK